ncbi:hypothetical protein [Nostoc sp.]
MRCLRRASLRDATRTPKHAGNFAGDANGWLSCGTLRERLRLVIFRSA